MKLNELPTQARLEQYEKQAQELVEWHRLGDTETFWHIKSHHPRLSKMPASEVRSATFSPADAQLIVARSNYFESWPDLTEYVAAVTQERSPVSQFESAVDAIVDGDEAALARLLRTHPDLIRARSIRSHHATLLHYVGANGTEKQRSPRNAVEIVRILLDAGAEVNAVGKMYGGTTALGLVATSVHPAQAGVQEALMEILLAHGAALDGAVAADYTRGSVVNACLANGRPNAAEFLAGRGARLDLDGAAGAGWLDVVKRFFHADGSLKAPATRKQMETGFIWACGCGRSAVVEFLLEMGVGVNAMPRGETGLHSAAYSGQSTIVKLLLERKSPLEIKDKTYDATPLGWALHGWAHPPETRDRRYHDVVALLVAAGASVEPDCLTGEKIIADPSMLAALRGKR
ncbi:MAG: ankyrin repeat domain-containing protein [Acidobacteriota bacterium]|nr:ankyrin repeat domain-containing protein [Acidobacteriota bacterium]